MKPILSILRIITILFVSFIIHIKQNTYKSCTKCILKKRQIKLHPFLTLFLFAYSVPWNEFRYFGHLTLKLQN